MVVVAGWRGGGGAAAAAASVEVVAAAVVVVVVLVVVVVVVVVVVNHRTEAAAKPPPLYKDAVTQANRGTPEPKPAALNTYSARNIDLIDWLIFIKVHVANVHAQTVMTTWPV